MEIFTMFSFYEILLIIAAAALMVKGTISFMQWAWKNLSLLFKKEENKKGEIKNIKERLDKTENTMTQESARLNKVQESLQFLIESDREDIKAWITDKYHHFEAQGWIDYYSLECIETRYARYVKEGGNSFIEDLMAKIRALPNQPPEEE